MHVDQTFEACIRRVHHHLPDEAERLLKSRVRLINVWRPIANTVAHKPLAMCDWRSVDFKKDFLATRKILPTYEGQTYNVRHNAGHEWWYMADQTPEEPVLVKCYDSEESGNIARGVPHTAFYDDSSPKEAPHRQSIEVRCLVFDAE